jgi:hypothetical protein
VSAFLLCLCTRCGREQRYNHASDDGYRPGMLFEQAEGEGWSFASDEKTYCPGCSRYVAPKKPPSE